MGAQAHSTQPRDQGTAEAVVETAAWRLLCLFTLSIALSIALAEILLGACFAATLWLWWRGTRPLPRTALDLPILFFVATGLLAAFVGLDTRQSLWGLRTYLQIVIVYLVITHVRTSEQIMQLVRLFLIGMAVTSSHTVLSAISPWELPDPFPGQMTESGQLLFAIGICASMLFYRVLWPRALPFLLALHGAALLINLKRGVWLGAFAAVTVVGLFRSRRLILIVVALLAAAFVLVTPVRTRVENTARDLFLPGSRYDIWKASVDVIQRFPLGVGRKNGTILRDYPNIPRNHKHAHNNVLQITLEGGYLGLAAFLWWMGAFGWQSWRTCRTAPPEDAVRSTLSLAVFSTFVGFHIAGLVEYNFGDSEVLEIFLLMMGIGLALQGKSDPIRLLEP